MKDERKKKKEKNHTMTSMLTMKTYRCVTCQRAINHHDFFRGLRRLYVDMKNNSHKDGERKRKPHKEQLRTTFANTT